MVNSSIIEVLYHFFLVQWTDNTVMEFLINHPKYQINISSTTISLFKSYKTNLLFLNEKIEADIQKNRDAQIIYWEN